MQNTQTTNDGRNGGITHGRTHAEGGMPSIVTNDGNKPIEVETGELIISRKAANLDVIVECSGAPKEVASKINELGGGVSFATGGSCKVVSKGNGSAPMMPDSAGRERMERMAERGLNIKEMKLDTGYHVDITQSEYHAKKGNPYVYNFEYRDNTGIHAGGIITFNYKIGEYDYVIENNYGTFLERADNKNTDTANMVYKRVRETFLPDAEKHYAEMYAQTHFAYGGYLSSTEFSEKVVKEKLKEFSMQVDHIRQEYRQGILDSHEYAKDKHELVKTYSPYLNKAKSYNLHVNPADVVVFKAQRGAVIAAKRDVPVTAPLAPAPRADRERIYEISSVNGEEYPTWRGSVSDIKDYIEHEKDIIPGYKEGENWETSMFKMRLRVVEIDPNKNKRAVEEAARGTIVRSSDASVRPSPSVSATVYPEGYRMEGNDGNTWEIHLSSTGVHRWVKVRTAEDGTVITTNVSEERVKEIAQYIGIGRDSSAGYLPSAWSRAKRYMDKLVELGYMEPHDFGMGKGKYIRTEKGEGMSDDQLAKALIESGMVKAEDGMDVKKYFKGGFTPYGGMDYEGMTPEEVWEEWLPEQRLHFLTDHLSEEEINSYSSGTLEKWSESNEIPSGHKSLLVKHMNEGQYAGGGDLKDKNFKVFATFNDGNVVLHKDFKLNMDNGYIQVGDNEPTPIEDYGDYMLFTKDVTEREAFEFYLNKLDLEDYANAKFGKGGFLYEVNKAGGSEDLRDRLMSAKNLKELEQRIIEKYGTKEGIYVNRFSKSTGAFYPVKFADGGDIYDGKGELWFHHFEQTEVKKKGAAFKLVKKILAEEMGADDLKLLYETDEDYVFELIGDEKKIMKKATEFSEKAGLLFETVGLKHTEVIHIPKSKIKDMVMMIKYPLLTPFADGGPVPGAEGDFKEKETIDGIKLRRTFDNGKTNIRMEKDGVIFGVIYPSIIYPKPLTNQEAISEYKKKVPQYLESQEKMKIFKKGGLVEGDFKFARDFYSDPYYTIGKPDDMKPLFSKKEVKLLIDKYKIILELRSIRNTREQMDEHLKEIKKEHPSAKLEFSDNEFGGNWRIWVKETEKKEGGGPIEEYKEKYANEDIDLLEKEGVMSIIDTKYGVLHGDYENGVFSFSKSDGSKIFSGNKQEAIEFVKSIYRVNIYKDEEFAGGGEITVTKISDIPDLKKKVDAGQVTYRGLGMGKLADKFYKLAGDSGVRIKVDGKEYYITDADFKELNWDFKNEKWLNKIKFSAPGRKFEGGGYVMGDEQKWLEEATRIVRKRVLLEPNDVDLDINVARESIKNGETPEQWVNWIIEKRDLDTFAGGGGVEKVLWAVKKGDPDHMEVIITNKAERIEAAKKWAEEHGYDRFRVSDIDMGKKPDFSGTVNIAARGASIKGDDSGFSAYVKKNMQDLREMYTEDAGEMRYEGLKPPTFIEYAKSKYYMQKLISDTEKAAHGMEIKPTGDYLADRILDMAVTRKYITAEEANIPHVQGIAQETSSSYSHLEEIGSSDWTFILMSFLNSLGFKADFDESGKMVVKGEIDEYYKKFAGGGNIPDLSGQKKLAKAVFAEVKKSIKAQKEKGNVEEYALTEDLHKAFNPNQDEDKTYSQTDFGFIVRYDKQSAVLVNAYEIAVVGGTDANKEYSLSDLLHRMGNDFYKKYVYKGWKLLQYEMAEDGIEIESAWDDYESTGKVEMTSNGIPFTEDIISLHGASFVLFPKSNHTKEDIEKAKRILKYQRDVVRMKVADDGDKDDLYKTAYFAHPAVRPLKWYQINQDERLIRRERKKGTSPNDFVEKYVLPNISDVEKENRKKHGDKIEFADGGEIYTHKDGTKYWADKGKSGKWTVFSESVGGQPFDEFGDTGGLSSKQDAIDIARSRAGVDPEEDPEAYFWHKTEKMSKGGSVKKYTKDEFKTAFNSWRNGPGFQDAIRSMNEKEVPYDNWTDMDIFMWHLENEQKEMAGGGSVKKEWFKEAIEEKAPYTLGGWSKSLPANQRRRLALKSRGKMSVSKKYLSAARALQALANVTKDEATRKAAQRDAAYFFSK